MSGASATGNVCVQRPAERCESAGSDCGWSSRTPWPEKATDLTRGGSGRAPSGRGAHVVQLA